MSFEDSGEPLEINPTIEVSISIEWRQRGGERKTMSISADDPELLRFVASLTHADEAGATMNISPRLGERLRREHLLVAAADVPRDPELLTDLPDELPVLFPHALRERQRDSRPLLVNPECHLQSGDQLPAALTGRVDGAEVFASRAPRLWVDDPGLRVLAMYGLASSTGEAALALLAGEVAPSQLSAAAREVLTAASILVPPDHAEARVRACNDLIEQCKGAYAQRGHAVLRSILNPLQLAMYRAYLRSVQYEGMLSTDRQVTLRLSKHREPLCEFIHRQTVDLVGRILDQAAKPTYSFFGAYQAGAVLEPHRDRPQCEWNMSLILDGEPEPTEDNAWPFFIESQGDAEEVRLGLSDAVIYSGANATHWREAQGKATTAGVFLHYVPTSFVGGLD
jgi:hypothetical protein